MTATAGSPCPAQPQLGTDTTTEGDGSADAGSNTTSSLDERKQQLLRMFGVLDGGSGSPSAMIADKPNESCETDVLEQDNHFASLQTVVESIVSTTNDIVET